MSTCTHALTIKPAVHTHIHLLMCAHHTTQVNTHTYSYTYSHSDTHTCTQMLTHTCTHMHWHKHMHAVTHFRTPICSHSFAHSHMHSHSHVNSQCLCIQSHACTCSDFTLYTKELTDSACIYSHIHSHTFMHIHSHTHTYSQLLSHMLSHTNMHTLTCMHTYPALSRTKGWPGPDGSRQRWSLQPVVPHRCRVSGWRAGEAPEQLRKHSPGPRAVHVLTRFCHCPEV